MGNSPSVPAAAQRVLLFRAARTAILLSVFFMVVYGGTNWLTAQRPPEQVGTWYFPWEATVIPYVPLLIIPYMSIDLFYFGAPFLCRSDEERRVFTKRVLFSILVAVSFFLLMPLRLAWPPRPHLGGWFGEFVEASCSAPFVMEFPHNLFPSLHIALRTILADIYGRHTRGILNRILHIWFFLIGLSTMLTWQHHLVDIAGGFVLGGFALYLFRETPMRHPVMPNHRLGWYYAGIAVAVLALGPFFGKWGVFLLWPAGGLAMVAAGYFGLGPGIYRKSNGQIPHSARFALAPVLLGQYLSLLYYRRQCNPWDQAAPGVLIGRQLNDKEAAWAVAQGVTAVLDLTAEFSEPAAFRALKYCHLPILDLTAPTPQQLDDAIAFIRAEAAKGVVYVHCKIGYSRSAAIIGAYLLATGQAKTPEDAIQHLRQVRPSIIVRPEAVEALRRFTQTLVDVSSARTVRSA